MSLHVIFGPMFSGKSTELSRLAARTLSVTHDPTSILLINSSLDTRSSEECIRTHTGSVIPAIKILHLSDIYKDRDIPGREPITGIDSTVSCNPDYLSRYNRATDIYIDEAQFFDDLNLFVRILLKNGKRIIVAGLDSDCHQRPFGQILSIIPMADSVEKKTALCSICSITDHVYRDAPFTIKKDDNGSIVDIGASEKYLSVCRKHIPE